MPPSPPAKLSSPLRLPPERPGAATTNLRPRRVGRDRSRRFALGLVGAMTLLSLLLGWFFSSWSQAAPPPGLAMGLASTVAQAPASAPPSGLGLPLTVDLPRSVDYVPEAHQLGQRLYLENCATCHIGVPPETLPSEAWRTLIQDSNHYGSEIQLPQGPSRALIWAYLRGFSRLKAEQEERVPYRLGRSRYFQAIHPNVALPSDLSLQSCASCHIAAAQFSFRPWREGGDP